MILPIKASSPGNGLSPSKNETGSETPLTHGYPLLYQRALKNSFSPDCTHPVPPTLRQLELPERRQSLLRRFPLPNITWQRPHEPGYLVAHASYRTYVNATPDVAIGMATVTSCATPSQNRLGEGSEQQRTATLSHRRDEA